MVDKNWTADEANAAQDAWDKVGGTGPRGPFYQWAALHELSRLETLYRAGDKFALLQAIALCARTAVVMPDWAADAYLRGFYSVLSYQAGSWDSAFGAPIPKGKHLATLRQRRRLWPRIYNHVRQLSEAGQPIDRALFERVAEDLGIGRTLCEDLYYSSPPVLSSPRKKRKLAGNTPRRK